MRRHDEPASDLRGGVALQDEACDLLLAFGQAVRRHEQRRDPRRVCRFDHHGDAAPAVGDQRGPVQDDPAAGARQGPRHRDFARRVGPLGAAQGAAGDREQHRREPPAVGPRAIRKVGQPALDAGRQRLDLPAMVEHDQPGRLGPFGIDRLADQQAAAHAVGQIAGDRAQEVELVGAELALAGLAVEREHPPGLRRRRAAAKPDQRLVLAAEGLDRRPEPRAAAHVAAGRLMQGRDPPPGAHDVGELVEILAVVLEREPVVRKLGKPLVVVAGDEQRRRVQRVEARRQVPGHGWSQCLGHLAPEGRQVVALARERGDPLPRPLRRVAPHVRIVRPPQGAAEYQFPGTDAQRRPA